LAIQSEWVDQGLDLAIQAERAHRAVRAWVGNPE
jgi:hypothetical protein